MGQKLFLALILLIIIFLIIFLSATMRKASAPTSSKLRIGSKEISIEIANTDETRTLGLGERDKLETDHGMLFVYETSGNYKFWMKGMKFPLDFIWIKDNQIVDLTENVPVENKPDNQLTIYQSQQPVNKILEVNADFVKNNGIKVGNKVEILP